ncbi:hypothetical protein LTR62_005078 [Meristemomyces frigidus]|uniref:Uncharacterized protein n=1 Tax=Meristemomyces frigidus TaxID=1508187 RepID=A0AAN7TJ26_9PEZI|nr:hypothetical protein LTR62_005078 [Meristemomyces frigidus]
MAGNWSVVETDYATPQTSLRDRERRVQEVPWEEISQIRNRELALVRRDTSPSPPPPEYGRDDERFEPRRGQEDYTTRRSERQRYADDAVVPYRRREDDKYGRQMVPRAAPSRYADDDTDSDASDNDRRRRRRGGNHRRTRSALSSHSSRMSRKADAIEAHKNGNNSDDDNQSRLWYSGKPRRDGSFFEKNFDSSYDGLIAAAAGAAMGAITVRNFTSSDGDMRSKEEIPEEERNSKLLKVVGGAAAGAALFNAGENWYRIFTEEREKRIEKREAEDEGYRAKHERRRRDTANGYMSRQAMAQHGFKMASKLL